MANNLLSKVYKKKISIPKDMNLIKCWQIVAPYVAEDVTDGSYYPIYNLLDTNCYNIGNIFVAKDRKDKTFFGKLKSTKQEVKILGPIDKYAVKQKFFFGTATSINFPIKTEFNPHSRNFKIKVFETDAVKVTFLGNNCRYYSVPADTVLHTNITIDRSSDEDLQNTKWIGIITETFATESFQLFVTSKKDTRVFNVSSGAHTVLFKFLICDLDEAGKIKNTRLGCANDFQWPAMRKDCDALPLTSCL